MEKNKLNELNSLLIVTQHYGHITRTLLYLFYLEYTGVYVLLIINCTKQRHEGILELISLRTQFFRQHYFYVHEILTLRCSAESLQIQLNSKS